MTNPNPRQIRQSLNTDRLLGLTDIPIQPPNPENTPENQNNSPSPQNSSPSNTTTPSSPNLTPVQKQQALDLLNTSQITICTKCPLHSSRNNTVCGEGNPDADLLFIGEGPGAEEDAQGRPFVGRSGKLLDKQIAAMGLTRDDIFIANIVKCRPPSNRVPTPDEAIACTPYLEAQIDTIQPKVIITLGATAAKLLLNESTFPITRLRGILRSYRGIHVIPTFHPAYLLRQYTPKNRQAVWSDLKQAMQILNLPSPA